MVNADMKFSLNKLLILSSLLTALLLFGCSQQLSTFNRSYTNSYLGPNGKLTQGQAIDTFKDYVPSNVPACTAIVCQDKVNPICNFWPTGGNSDPNKWLRCPFDSGLKTSKCFERQFDPEKTTYDAFFSQLKANKETPRQFMIGMGPSFGDLTLANPYCENRMTMAVKWLSGDPLNNYVDSYPIPDPSVASSCLDRKITPVYVLYSASKNIDVTRAIAIADKLKDSGPAIIVTEIELDKTASTNAVSKIQQQLNGMKNACKNCLIALGVQMKYGSMTKGAKGETDYTIIDEIFSDTEAKKNTDLVAFGINSKTYLGDCKSAAIFYDASDFAQQIWYKYKKQSIIPYMLFEPEDATSSNPTAGGCFWNQNIIDDATTKSLDQVTNPYVGFFSNIELLASSGVIGAAPYSFSNSSYNPLNCKNCQIGINKQRTSAFFDWCTSYVTDLQKNPAMTRAGVIKSERGATCLIGAEIGSWFTRQYNENYIGGPELKDPFKAKGFSLSCSDCIIDSKAGLPGQAKSTYIWQVPSSSLPDIPSIASVGGSICNAFPEIESMAAEASGSSGSLSTDDTSFDAMLVRSIIYYESSFDPCAASKPDITSNNAACNFRNERNIKTGLSQDVLTISEYNTINCQNAIATGGTLPQLPSNKKYCAYGLMQVIENPYTYGLTSSTEDNLAQSCAPQNELFNPFNTTQNICLGTKKLASMMIAAKSTTQTFTSQTGIALTSAETKIYNAYFALHNYAGDLANVRSSFSRFASQVNYCQRNADPTYCIQDANNNWIPKAGNYCVEINDFIQYYKLCAAPKIRPDLTLDYSGPYAPGNYQSDRDDVGYSRLLMYRALIEKCSNSACLDSTLIQSASGLPPSPRPTPGTGGSGSGSSGTGNSP